MASSDSLANLRLLAKDLGLRGWTSLRKAQLIELLETHSKALEVKEEVKEEALTVEEVKVPKVKERRRDQRERIAKEKEMKAEGVEIPPKVKQATKKTSAWMDYLADRRATGLTLKQSMADKAGYAEFKAKWVKPESKVES